MIKTCTRRVTACFTLALIVLTAAGCGNAASPTAGGPPPGLAMKPTFAEEFDGTTIDTKRWNKDYGSRGYKNGIDKRSLWSNGELQVYFDPGYLKLGIDPFAVKDGVLTITAKPLDAKAKAAAWQDASRIPNLIKPGAKLPRIEYSSGAITTRDVFEQQYGYFEIRASWSSGKGLWPAFWLLPATGAWPPEIDVIEAHGDKPGVAYQTIHSKVAPKRGQEAKVRGSQQQFHTYGALWQPDRVDYYIDGMMTGSIPAPADLNQPMYLLANLAIGGYWPGNPDPDPNFRATYAIDYIRVWQFEKTPAAKAR